jgi:hypothetical protein
MSNCRFLIADCRSMRTNEAGMLLILSSFGKYLNGWASQASRALASSSVLLLASDFRFLTSAFADDPIMLLKTKDEGIL